MADRAAEAELVRKLAGACEMDRLTGAGWAAFIAWGAPPIWRCWVLGRGAMAGEWGVTRWLSTGRGAAGWAALLGLFGAWGAVFGDLLGLAGVGLPPLLAGAGLAGAGDLLGLAGAGAGDLLGLAGAGLALLGLDLLGLLWLPDFCPPDFWPE